MAKRKTPKAEKVINLAPKAEKINEQQLAGLQATIKTVDQLTGDIGRVEVQKYSLLKAMENIQHRLEDLRQEFKNDYGTDHINIQDGTINYPEESNQQENGETNKED